MSNNISCFNMIIHDLSLHNSILNQFVKEIRCSDIQKDRWRFRKNMERIGEILAYEMSKTFEFKQEVIRTPLGEKELNIPANEIVLCSILRAGIPLHQGVLNYLDSVDNAFISAYRIPKENQDFDIDVEYLATPSLQDRTLIIADPMLATGLTMENVYHALQKTGIPKQIHILSIIGATPGIELVKKVFPKDTHLWIATVDNKLNEKGYIIPGLGDAGDLCFGSRL